jgi:DNA-binding NtrC family response regulator
VVLVAAGSDDRLRRDQQGSLSPAEIERCHRECAGDLDRMAERLEVSRRALGRRAKELGLAIAKG